MAKPPRRAVELPAWWQDIRTPPEHDSLRRFATGAFDAEMGERSTQAGIEAAIIHRELCRWTPLPKYGWRQGEEDARRAWHTIEPNETPSFAEQDDVPEHRMAAAEEKDRVVTALASVDDWEHRALVAYYAADPECMGDVREVMGGAAFDALWTVLRYFEGLVRAAVEMPAIRAWAEGQGVPTDVLLLRMRAAALQGHEAAGLADLLGRKRTGVAPVLCGVQVRVVAAMRARRRAA